MFKASKGLSARYNVNGEVNSANAVNISIDMIDLVSDLPSADAWGKKRQTYYSTDYVDEDYGGTVN